jgi:hypothetical protein
MTTELKESELPANAMMVTLLGHAMVSVADCAKCQFSAHPKTEMTLAAYLQYWEAHDCTAPDPDSQNLLYLKDWHFIQ